MDKEIRTEDNKTGSDTETLSRKSRETRSVILAAAARMLARQGYSDCSLREIAKAAGMRAGSVYYHFPSKDDLLIEVLNIGNQRLRQNVQQALDAAGPGVAGRLRAAIRAHVTSFLDIRDDAHLYMRIYGSLPPALQRRRRPSRRAYLQIWYDLLEEGQRTGEIDPDLELRFFLPFLLNGLNHVQEWFRPSDMTIDEVCAMIDTTVLRTIVREPK